MKKKYSLILTTIIILLSIYFLSSKDSTFKIDHKTSIKKVQRSKQIRTTSKNSKRNIQKPTNKNISIDNLHPCEIFDIKETKLWKYLPKDSTLYRYKSLIEKLDLYVDKRHLTPKDLDYIEHLLSSTVDHLQYAPFYPEILKKIHSFQTTSSRIQGVTSQLEDYFQTSTNQSYYLEDHLVYSKYEHDYEDYEASSLIIQKLLQRDELTDFQLFNKSQYQDFYKRALKEAKTPNQLVLTMVELNHIPIPDFTHLIDLKERNKSKKFQKYLDQISERLIQARLKSKDSSSTDFLSYNIALKIHSKSNALKEKHGNYEGLQNKIIKEENKDNPYNNQECDDREIIDLCDEYCKK